MIYNLLQYLKDNLPEINFVVNGFGIDSKIDEVMIGETGGEPQHWYERTDWAVQFISRSSDVTVAKQNIEAVYNLLKNKFGVVLPRVIVGDTEYEEIKTFQISPLQTPGYIGSTEENLEMFSFNSTITTT